MTLRANKTAQEREIDNEEEKIDNSEWVRFFKGIGFDNHPLRNDQHFAPLFEEVQRVTNNRPSRIRDPSTFIKVVKDSRTINYKLKARIVYGLKDKIEYGKLIATLFLILTQGVLKALWVISGELELLTTIAALTILVDILFKIWPPWALKYWSGIQYLQTKWIFIFIGQSLGLTSKL